MQKVGYGLVIGLIGELALLITLGATVSLSILGWAVGVGYGVFTTVALGRGLTRAGATGLGPANRVTLARAMLVGGVAALVADSFVRPAAVTALVAISVIALALDAVDGWVARRTNSVTPLGARFDREVDAFLILVLSVYVAHSTGQWWVLLIGAARYAYGAAGWLLPWLRGPLPPRYWGKVVAAIQGIVLTVAAADVLPILLMNVMLGVALVLLAESFGSSVWWLWRQRQPIADAPHLEMAAHIDAPVHVDGAVVDGAVVDGAEQERSGHRDGPKHRLARRSGLRTAATWSATVLACLLVWFALVSPNDLSQVTLGAFLRLPVEGLIVVAVALVLPPAARRILAAVVGVILGLLTILKLFDMGFFEAFDRPFNPVADWTYGGSAVDLLIDSVGRTAAFAVVIAAVALIVGLLILMPLALVRLTRLASEHRTTSIRYVTVIGAVWILCAAFGLQLVQGAPIASASAAELTYDQVSQVRDGIAAQEAFGAAVADDPFDSTPTASVPTPTGTATTPPLTSKGATPAALPPMLKAAQATEAAAAPTATADPAPANSLLSALKGKDVIIAFVESYGRVAVQGSTFSPGVDAVLDAGTDQLRQAGFSAKSAFLTSPTFGGISWLAHSTLQSGLWVDNQVLYDQLIASNRLTLTSAFKRAGWRTVADTPATERPWPEGQSFYHYDKIYDANNVGYQGPTFGYAPMTDQYTLSAFQRNEFAPQHAPVMAEMDLVSSHAPWAPLPRMVDWNDVGDGSIFNPMPDQGEVAADVWTDPARVQVEYGKSVEYTMSTLVSFVQKYGDPNLVVIALGDHQPAAVVTGDDPTHDVPISIIAHDPAVLQKIDSWGWQDGLRPDPQAPVSRMDTFRDRFLTAFQ